MCILLHEKKILSLFNGKLRVAKCLRSIKKVFLQVNQPHYFCSPFSSKTLLHFARFFVQKEVNDIKKEYSNVPHDKNV